MPSWWQNGFITAPDQETYNGYPWLQPDAAIAAGISSATWTGLSCGECFQVAGPETTQIYMVSDICDKGCCSNCQGKTPNDDIQALDLEIAQWLSVSNRSGGDLSVSYRKVSCPTGKPLSFYFTDEGTPQLTYFRLRPYNHAVGVATVEVRGGAAGGTGGQWVHLQRHWEGLFNWTGRGSIAPPFRVRMTAITGETIEFPMDLQTSDLAQLAKFSAGTNFNPSYNAYGSGSATEQCQWPGPPSIIFDDNIGRLSAGYQSLQTQWRDYATASLDQNTWSWSKITSGCRTGTTCISAPCSTPYVPSQFGYDYPVPLSMYTGFTFWAKLGPPGTAWPYFAVDIKCASTGWPQGTSTRLFITGLTTTWRQYTFYFSNFTGLGGYWNVIQIRSQNNAVAPVALQIDDFALFPLRPLSVSSPGSTGSPPQPGPGPSPPAGPAPPPGPGPAPGPSPGPAPAPGPSPSPSPQPGTAPEASSPPAEESAAPTLDLFQ